MVIWIFKTFSIQIFYVFLPPLLVFFFFLQVQIFIVLKFYLFLRSVSVRFLSFLSFIIHILAWNVPLIYPVFLKGPLVFPILLFSSFFFFFFFFFCIVHWRRLSHLSLLFSGTLHSNEYIFPFLLCLLFLLFSQLLVRPPQTAILLFHLFFLGMVLITASCTMSRTFVHSSSVALSIDLIPWIYWSLPLYNRRRYDLGHTWMV